MKNSFEDFKKIIHFDMEFRQKGGDKPSFVCAVFKEHRGECKYFWGSDVNNIDAYIRSNNDSLFTAFHASAEGVCLKSINAEYPMYLIDQSVEYRRSINGLQFFDENGNTLPRKLGLESVIRILGFETLYGEDEKFRMRQLIQDKNEYSDDEKKDILNYCKKDVLALEYLFEALKNEIKLPLALFSGEYIKVISDMEYFGIPIDTLQHEKIKSRWPVVLPLLVKEVNKKFPVFIGELSLSKKLLAQEIESRGLRWPQTPSGQPATNSEAMDEVVARYPEFALFKRVLQFTSQKSIWDFPVGEDGRNRTMQSQYSTVTGRNAPSSSKAIMSKSATVKYLIKAEAGTALTYSDFSSQEVGIAAALSGDENLIADYKTGKVYLNFSISAGLVPVNGSKETHPDEVECGKTGFLSIQYGAGVEQIAARVGRSVAVGENLFEAHKRRYPKYWHFIESIKNYAAQNPSIKSTYSWPLHITTYTKSTTIGNFPMQANGADITRLACILAKGAGLKILASIHDAILIESKLDRAIIEADLLNEKMIEAAKIVLNGFELRLESRTFKFPDTFDPGKPKARHVWELINKLIEGPSNGDE